MSRGSTARSSCVASELWVVFCLSGSISCVCCDNSYCKRPHSLDIDLRHRLKSMFDRFAQGEQMQTILTNKKQLRVQRQHMTLHDVKYLCFDFWVAWIQKTTSGAKSFVWWPTCNAACTFWALLHIVVFCCCGHGVGGKVCHQDEDRISQGRSKAILALACGHICDRGTSHGLSAMRDAIPVLARI